MRSILGFLGFYQTFIPRFAEILRPLFDAQTNTKHHNKTTEISWTPDHQAAVDKAVAALEQSVLYLPIDTNDETDASAHTIAAVLNIEQDDK